MTDHATTDHTIREVRPPHPVHHEVERLQTQAITAREELGAIVGPTYDEPERLSWDSRARRVVTIYVPLSLFLIVLLFPFYWMAITSVKPDYEMYDYKKFNPFWVHSPTFENIRKLLFETEYPHWLMTTMIIAMASTFLSVASSVLAAYAIERLRFKGAQHVGLAIYLAYLVPPTILFIPLATIVFQFGLFDSPLALILTYPTFLVPFCTWLLIGYFKSIPYELEECALIDGASRLQILRRITLPLAVPGLISAGIFAFTLSWNEFIYALAFIQSTEKKTVPVAILTELVTGDVYQWGSLMAGSLLGSIPVAIIYSFFVEYYVSSMTGAVKE
jgi:multiple sugar transport system permease protein